MRRTLSGEITGGTRSSRVRRRNLSLIDLLAEKAGHNSSEFPKIPFCENLDAKVGRRIKTTGTIGRAAEIAKAIRVGLSIGTRCICLTTVKLVPRSANDDASGSPRAFHLSVVLPESTSVRTTGCELSPGCVQRDYYF